MTLNELQYKVMLSRNDDQINNSLEERAMFLSTEIGELIKELLKYLGMYGTIGRNGSVQRTGQEISDVIWNLCDIANRLGLDLNVEMENMIKRHSERKWNKVERHS